MKTSKQSRIIMRIELLPKSKDSLTTLCHNLGVKQVAAMSRITEWFTDQDETVKALILGLIPNTEKKSVVGMVLERMKR